MTVIERIKKWYYFHFRKINYITKSEVDAMSRVIDEELRKGRPIVQIHSSEFYGILKAKQRQREQATFLK